MDTSRFDRVSDTEWRVAPHGPMRVPAVLFADEALVQAMDDKVYEQMTNVASLPGIVGASYAMPDAHWGYGFPIGGVAAFDPADGVVSAGGVGFDISCGVRTLTTGISADALTRRAARLPRVDIAHPGKAIGNTTVTSMQAGISAAGSPGGSPPRSSTSWCGPAWCCHRTSTRRCSTTTAGPS